MLDLGANATKVRHHLMMTTQKVVTQHDVQNIRTASKASTSDTDAVHQVVQVLNQTDNAIVRIVASEDDGTVQSVFYQTAFMRHMFDAYPETVIFDATYKVNNRNMPLFLPLVIDSAGYSQVAAVILTIDERSETLRAALEHLSELSDKVCDVRCLVVDKDLTAIDVLQSQFTNAAVNLCQFHCLRTFRREVTESRMQITPSQKTTVLELLTKLSYASSVEDYDTHYKELTDLNIPTVTDYFNTNWHGCREQWVPCFKNSASNFGLSGTQRIESLHQKVKQVVKCNADIVSFYKNLLVFLSAHQSESEHRMFDAFNRFPVQDKHSILATYSTELTHHAYSLIRQQHSAAAKVTLQGTTVQSHEGMLTLDSTSCQCQFFKTTALPCRHIFKYRQDTGMPVYEATLVPERWRRSYWLAALNIPLRPNLVTTVSSQPQRTQTILSETAKYRAAMSVFSEMAMALSQSGTNEFNARLAQMKAVCDTWKKGDDVMIMHPTDDEERSGMTNVFFSVFYIVNLF